MILKSDNIQRMLAAILMMPNHVQYYLETCALALLFFFAMLLYIAWNCTCSHPFAFFKFLRWHEQRTC